MRRLTIYIFLLIITLISAEISLSGQEVLKSSRIQARANRKNLPALGVPLRVNGEIDPAVWYKDGLWRGADSLSAPPFWVTETIDVESVVKTAIPSEIVRFCREWVMEKPQGPVHIVTGQLRDKQFIAVCTRARSSISWKSIGFIVPREGLMPGKSVWDYSCSVNWIEWFIGYDLFPKLPPALQELVEEMTAAEHLCSFNEFDPLEFEEPEFDIDYEWEMDLHEIQ
jgi:hypothetical protein